MSKDLGKSTSYAYYVAEGGTKTPQEYGEMLVNIDTVATRAEDAADSAAESATGALNSKNAAQTAATTATTKASEATTAAQTATTAAESAQADAGAAALDASQALSAASTATTKASEATTAAATATSAKTDAVAANTAAQSAKTAAQTAQAGAETAAASVSASAAQIQTNTDDISELKEDIDQLKSELNVIKENTWNLWDGSYGYTQADPITGSSVIYVACSPAIPVTAGKYYSFGVVSNPLPTKVLGIVVRWYSSTGTNLGTNALYISGGYLTWAQAPANAVYAVFRFTTNNSSIAITPEELLTAGYKVIFAEGRVNFHSLDNTLTYYNFEANEWIPSKFIDPTEIDKSVVRRVSVGASNSNYANLRTALDDIFNYGNPSEKIQYVVEIKEGTYDISSYYSSAEKSAVGYKGMIVPDWVTLKGVGNREKTILQYVLDTASNNICVLNLQNTCGLENLTVYGVKTRYCIHDDFGNTDGIPYTRFCKNVHFKGDTMTYGSVYGAGIKSNAEWTFENCIFESLTEVNYQGCFSVHGSQITQVGSNLVKFINCRFVGHGSSVNNALLLSTLMSTAGYFQNYCIIHGCNANGRLILREENVSEYGAGINWWATGFASSFTDKLINNTDGLDYSANLDVV